jgi:hypothetical protein
LGVGLTTPHRKIQIRYEKLNKTSDLHGFFVRTTQAKEYGHEIWKLECKEFVDNIKMDLLELGVSVVDWIGLVQDRYRWRALVIAVMNLRVP